LLKTPKPRRRRVLSAVVACTASVAMALTACSSGSSSNSAGNNGSTKKAPDTIKIGVLTDTTGVASSGYQTTETGIKAYVNAVNAAGGINGHKLSYVMGDSTSTPTGALTAVQKMVQDEKVFAIVSVSSDFFGAEQFALKNGIPVIGVGVDGPEWAQPSNTNLFSVEGTVDLTHAYTTQGELMKALGVTNCAAIGYSSSPSASKSSANAQTSCKAAGLKADYLTNIAFGDTNVGPIALAMKKAKVDGVTLEVVGSTGFALVAALRQYGVTMKGVVNSNGYGADLLRSAPAVKAAQGFQFSSYGQPMEMNTPATKTFAKNLAAVGYTELPTFAIQIAYQPMAAVAAGLRAAGANPTQQSFMTALRKINNFDADGLLAPNKINFSDYSPNTQCAWTVTLEGTKFVPVKGMPFCGTKISG
jgi:branched-chain amino acid transport system substrate-binding protein